MIQTLMQILPCLLASALLGGLVGWLLKHVDTKKAIARVEDEWKLKRHQEQADFDTFKAALDAEKGNLSKRLVSVEGILKQKITDIASLETSLATSQNQTKEREKQLLALRERLAELEPLLALKEEHQHTITQLRATVETISREKQSLVTLADQRERRVQELSAQKQELESRFSDISDRLDKCEKEGEMRRVRIAALEESEKRLTIQAREAEERFRDAAAQLESSTTQHRADLAHMWEQVRELEPLTGEISTLRAQLAASADELERTRLHAQGLEPLVAEVAEWKERCTLLQREAVNEIESYRMKVSDLERLGGQLAQARLRITELEPMMAKLEMQNKEMTQRISTESGEWAERYAALQRDTAAEMEGYRARLSHLEPITGDLEQAHARIAQLEPLVGQIEFKDHELGTLRHRLGELEGHLGNAIAQVGDKENYIHKLHEENAGLRDSLQTADIRMNELDTLYSRASDELDTVVQDRDRRISVLTVELGNANDRLNETEGALRDCRRRFDEAALLYTDELGFLRAKLTELESRPAPKPAEDRPWDDLKLIYGVGPVLEKMLHRLGIHWFRQVATWTEEDIDRIDAQLEQFHGRIRRENWVASAQEEHFKKYGERL